VKDLLIDRAGFAAVDMSRKRVKGKGKQGEEEML